MATKSRTRSRKVYYPDGDGKPMAETPLHRRNMTDLIWSLDRRYASEANVYVSGNMMMYYVAGNPRKHISPDVFVVWDIPKLPERRLYQVWVEGKGPDVAFEITSKSTRKEDLVTKFALYRDVLKVSEYFLFDPYTEYLDPPLQGYRLRRGRYQSIRPVMGRIPSDLLELHLERVGWQLRLYDLATQSWLPTGTDALTQIESERLRTEEERHRAEAAERRAEEFHLRAEAERQRAEDARRYAEAERQRADLEHQLRERSESEMENLRRAMEEMRGRTGQDNSTQ